MTENTLEVVILTILLFIWVLVLKSFFTSLNKRKKEKHGKTEQKEINEEK